MSPINSETCFKVNRVWWWWCVSCLCSTFCSAFRLKRLCSVFVASGFMSQTHWDNSFLSPDTEASNVSMMLRTFLLEQMWHSWIVWVLVGLCGRSGVTVRCNRQVKGWIITASDWMHDSGEFSNLHPRPLWCFLCLRYFPWSLIMLVHRGRCGRKRPRTNVAFTLKD